MKPILTILVILFAAQVIAQDRYFTKTGHIDFYSHAPLEDIEANNEQVAAFLDIKTGKLTFAALMKSFDFEKALMQEHFNENYVESDEFPKATFKGEILNYEGLDLTKQGKIDIQVQGKLTLHGETQDLTTPATLDIQSGKIIGKAKFIAKPADFKINIPNAVKNNIAKDIEVTVEVELLPYKK